MFKKLLVPLDGSALAEQALGHAAALARTTGATIDLLHVEQPVPYTGMGEIDWTDRGWKGPRDYVESIAKELTAGSSVAITHRVMEGEPVEAIAARAADIAADLVVLTTHGRTGFSRAWFGSIADGVLRRLPVPVWMLRPVDAFAPRGARRRLARRVLVSLDGSARAASILPHAAAFAATARARVTLIRVVQPQLVFSPAGAPFAYKPSLADDPRTVQVADEARGELSVVAREFHARYGIDVAADVLIAPHVASGIVDYARANQMELIAMATHGRGATRLIVGSIADKVMRASELPMLLVSPQGNNGGHHVDASRAASHLRHQPHRDRVLRDADVP